MEHDDNDRSPPAPSTGNPPDEDVRGEARDRHDPDE
jgi:hypothetical protein